MRVNRERQRQIFTIAGIALILLGLGILFFSISANAQPVTDRKSNYTVQEVSSPINNGPGSPILDVNVDSDGLGKNMTACYQYSNFNSWKVALSENQGSSWTEVEFLNSTNLDVVSTNPNLCDVERDGDTILAAFEVSNFLSFAVSQNGGATWDVDNSTFHETDGTVGYHNATGLAVDILPNGTFVIVHQGVNQTGGQDSNFLSVSHDNGQTWQNTTLSRHTNVGSNFGVNIGHFNSTIWYVATAQHDGSNGFGNLFFTNDGGENFQLRNRADFNGFACNDNSGDVRAMDVEAPTETTVIVAASSSSCNDLAAANQLNQFKSNNQGQDWDDRDISIGDCDSLPNSGFVAIDLHAVSGSRYAASCLRDEDFDRAFEYRFTEDGGTTIEGFTLDFSNYLDVQDGDDYKAHGQFYINDTVTQIGILHWNDTSEKMQFIKKKAPPPGVVAQASIFGNAQAIRTEWQTDYSIFAKDINGDDRLFRLNQDLATQQDSDMCTESRTNNAHWLWVTIEQEAQLENTDKVFGLEILANQTNSVFEACAIDGDTDGDHGAIAIENNTFGFQDMAWNDISEAPTRIDGLDTHNVTTGQTTGSAEGEWIVLTSGLYLTTTQGDLPHIANMTDVATDYRFNALTRPFCGISDTNDTGLTCVNQNGGVIAQNNSITGQDITVFDGNVFVNNGSAIQRFEISGSNFLARNSTDFGPDQGMTMSKSGDWLITIPFNAESQNITLINTTTMKVVTETTDFTDSEIRDVDMDFSANFLYAVTKTTVFKIGVFNHTEGPGEDGNIIGTQNPEVGTSSEEETGTVEDEDGGETVTEGVDPFATPAIGGTTSTESGLIMTVIAVLIFTAMGFALFENGNVATLFGITGFGLSVAVGWVPPWFTILIVLLCVALIVVMFQTGGMSIRSTFDGETTRSSNLMNSILRNDDDKEE